MIRAIRTTIPTACEMQTTETSMITLHDRAAGSAAKILPDRGFNCFSFEVTIDGRPIEVLDAEPDFVAGTARPSSSGIPLLFPFPNRIRDGRFRWADRDYSLPLPEGKPNAIHGLVIDREWRVVDQSEQHVTGEFQLSRDAADCCDQWPTDFRIKVRYALAGETLRCDIHVSNPDTKPLPWGFGTHPYFRVPLSPQSCVGDCLVQAPTAEVWELDDFLPTGRKLPVSGGRDLRDGQALAGLKLDDVLTGVTAHDGQVRTIVMDPQAGLQVMQVFDASFRELVAYTPPHGRSVCLEPYTCVTDAVNLQPRGIDSGWRVLAPGAEVHLWFAIHVGRVIA
jgi:aldose 1-epimerase